MNPAFNPYTKYIVAVVVTNRQNTNATSIMLMHVHQGSRENWCRLF